MVTVVLRTAYCVYLATLLYLVWEPDASTPGGVVVLLADLLEPLGLGDPVRVVEVALNVVLFVPFSLLGAFVLDRWRVVGWVLAGLALTLAIEAMQWLFLSGRSATVSDLVANTSGALLGVLLADAVRRVLSGVPRRSTADRMAP
ncbi:VanZ family protein [Nocardioides sp. GXQ0305]|uniref:VanZ family protein n=1 Tax=Nocardioides sp. GXQ0305 TaxID=3423912 RepID=UPI003D7E38D3